MQCSSDEFCIFSSSWSCDHSAWCWLISRLMDYLINSLDRAINIRNLLYCTKCQWLQSVVVSADSSFAVPNCDISTFECHNYTCANPQYTCAPTTNRHTRLASLPMMTREFDSRWNCHHIGDNNPRFPSRTPVCHFPATYCHTVTTEYLIYVFNLVITCWTESADNQVEREMQDRNSDDLMKREDFQGHSHPQQQH